LILAAKPPKSTIHPLLFEKKAGGYERKCFD
jgi:hypothetical protein